MIPILKIFVGEIVSATRDCNKNDNHTHSRDTMRSAADRTKIDQSRRRGEPKVTECNTPVRLIKSPSDTMIYTPGLGKISEESEYN